MRDEYDFSNSTKNPYIDRLGKTQITIRIDNDTIKYFKNQAKEVGISYQNLINLYLRDCAEKKKKPEITWQ